MAGVTAAALLSGWWLVAWQATSRGARNLEGLGLVPVQPPAQVSVTATLRVLVLVGLGLTLVAAGQRLAAVLVPALAVLPAVIWPMWADVTGPAYLGLQVEEVVPWHLRLGACVTLAVVAIPAAVAIALGREDRPSVRPAGLARRLAVPAAVAGVAAAFDWVDPNGPGPIRWPLLAMYGLAAALLVLSGMPRLAAWAGVVLVPLLYDVDVAGALATGTNLAPALRESAGTAATAVAVAVWALLAPRLARTWVRVMRPEPAALPTQSG